MIHGDLQRRHRHPNLAIAKAGNASAALALARDLLSDTATGKLEKLLQGRKPFLVPVSAIKVRGSMRFRTRCDQRFWPDWNVSAYFSGRIGQTKAV